MQTYLGAMRAGERNANPLFDFLDARLAGAHAGEATVILPVSRRLAQGAGLVAGGILATLADESMAHAVLSLLGPGQSTVTIEMNIRYLRATSASADAAGMQGEISAAASVLKAGRSVMTAEARVSDPTGRLLAVAGSSFQILGAK